MTGDAEAFRGLFDQWFEPVRRYAARRCPAAQVDDVVAEVFTIAWRRRDVVPEPALPWLLGVARRVLANEYRAQARRNLLSAQLQLIRLPVCREPMQEICLDPVLHAALGQLSARDREVLLLSVWDGLSGAEIAEVTGLSVNAVHLRLSRARRRLAALVDPSGDSSSGPTGSRRSRHSGGGEHE